MPSWAARGAGAMGDDGSCVRQLRLREAKYQEYAYLFHEEAMDVTLKEVEGRQQEGISGAGDWG